MNIGRNQYTTATANCYWNGTNYALGGNNTHGCDNYRVVACAAGYYTDNPTSYWGTDCIPVGAGYYSAEGEIDRTACTNAPANTTYTGGATSNTCPWECNSGYNLTNDGTCAQLCTAGITQIKLGGGLSVPLYKSKQTSHAIGVKYANQVCYVNLTTGRATGAINVNIGGTTYHTVH